MIKFSRTRTEKAKVAVASLKAAKTVNGSYNTPEVNAALAEMFCGKCYICENKEGITSFQIEHLKAHKGDTTLKYDWNNLFWACAHCNNMKRVEDEPILDCTQVDVDRKIAFRKDGYFGKDEKYEFIPLEETIETKNTANLLYRAYYGNTPQKRMEAVNIRRALRRNLSDFKNLVREYYEAEDYDKQDILYAIKKEVGKESAFAAFKRWLLWDNKEKYGDLLNIFETGGDKDEYSIMESLNE